jgi:hypothetical protein
MTSLAARSAEPANQASSITVDDPRAVATAVLLLIERYGYVITYEDAPLTYSEDLQDVTLERHADLSFLKKPGTVREIIPVGERLTLNLMPASAMTDSKNMAVVIGQMLKDHARSNQGARFRLHQTDGVFQIVPSEVRDSSGQWVAYTPVLDTKITLPGLDRSAAAMLDAICKAVSDAMHIHVVVGHIPVNTLASYHGILTASDEPARNVLMRALNDTGRRLVWGLDYDAATREYYLSIGLVPDRPSSDGLSPKPTQSSVQTKAASKVQPGAADNAAVVPR